LIDKAFDKMIDIGERHPECQSTILNTVDKIGSIVKLVWSKVEDFIRDVVLKITAWVKEVADKVSSFFLDRFQDITRLFGSFMVTNDFQMLKGEQTLEGRQILEESIKQLAKALETQIESGKEFTLSYASCPELNKLLPEISEEDSTDSEKTAATNPMPSVFRLSRTKLLILMSGGLASLGIMSYTYLSSIRLAMEHDYDFECDLTNMTFKGRKSNNVV
jgi:hypothetical protein